MSRTSEVYPGQTGKELPLHTLQAGHTLLVEGPASVRLASGTATCLGAPMRREHWAMVRGERRFLAETEDGASVEVKLGMGGKFEEIKESTLPASWREASQIVCQSHGKTVILGDVDSGKSTFSTFLANECFKQGLRTRVIDADIGQADIGPPATISTSSVGEHVFSLQELNPEKSLFMGDTTPSFITEKLGRGILRLVEYGGHADVLLVNTDGWVQGEEAFRYKSNMIESIRPDFVFGIEFGGELEGLLNHQQCTTLKLGKSQYARTRSRDERKRAREFGYKRFLQNAKRLELVIRGLELRRFNSFHQLKIREDENLQGVLAGFLNEDGFLLSIGRIERFRDGRLTVNSSLEENPRIVELGSIVLSPTYEELGFDA